MGGMKTDITVALIMLAIAVTVLYLSWSQDEVDRRAVPFYREAEYLEEIEIKAEKMKLLDCDPCEGKG